MKKIDTVVFDLDSTLVKIEGLDWLAEQKELGARLKQLTKESMEGSVDFNKALTEKMELISPSYLELVRLGRTYCRNIVKGARQAIEVLKSKGKDVWMVTGNFNPAVGIVAEKLGIPKGKIISNKIFFTEEGSYRGFDSGNPLSRNGGKAEVIRQNQAFKGKRIAYIGDGMTDLEVKNDVSLFIGFGGVAERPIVKDGADIYITSPTLAQIPQIIGS